MWNCPLKPLVLLHLTCSQILENRTRIAECGSDAELFEMTERDAKRRKHVAIVVALALIVAPARGPTGPNRPAIHFPGLTTQAA